MSLQDHMKIVSVDDHIVEHPRVWKDRLPAKFREAGPRSVKSRSGNDQWLYEGRRYPHIAIGAVAGKPREKISRDPISYDDMLPGYYDPVERLKAMDLDGVWASVGFPSFPRFAGMVFTVDGEDKELALACVQAYNDFVLDEWCATAPDRFIPMVIAPLWDQNLTVKEIERCAAKGARTLSFIENPIPLGLPSFFTDGWDRVFAACQAAEMPLSIHFGSSGKVPHGAPDAPGAVDIALLSQSSQTLTAELCFSKVFHRFPGLKVALSEGGIGWLPFMLERMDYTWDRQRFWNPEIDQHRAPSTIFREHIFGCFIDDEVGIRERHTIGVGNLLIEADYPHSDSHFPHTRKRVSEMLIDVPDDEAHRITELNARALYRFWD